MVHIKCPSAHSNMSLYCGFKKLPVKGLRHCVLHNAISYLNKGLPSSYLGRENNNTYYTSSKLHNGYFAEEESQVHKSGRACYYSIVVLH